MGQKFDFSISSGDYIQCIVKDVKVSWYRCLLVHHLT